MYDAIRRRHNRPKYINCGVKLCWEMYACIPRRPTLNRIYSYFDLSIKTDKSSLLIWQTLLFAEHDIASLIQFVESIIDLQFPYISLISNEKLRVISV
jgi:hypothetical protein